MSKNISEICLVLTDIDKVIDSKCINGRPSEWNINMLMKKLKKLENEDIR